jgi:hypothetical protein
MSRAPLLGLALLFLSAALVVLLILCGAELVAPQVAIGMLLGCLVTAVLALLSDGWTP